MLRSDEVVCLLANRWYCSFNLYKMERIFILLTADSEDDLAIKVKDKIEQGWICLGKKSECNSMMLESIKGRYNPTFQQQMVFVI
jgi:thermostable 8-oxoguanine DNA glycosylase